MKWNTRNIEYAGLLLFIITAYFNIGHLHSDEHFQLIEFAQYKLGNIDSSDLAWEFHERMRPSLQVWLCYFIIKVLYFFQLKNPFTIALILRLFSATFYWFVITKMNRLLSERYFIKKGFKTLFFLFTYTVWFVPFASVHFSSENFSAIFLLLAMYYLLQDPDKQKNLLLTGLFLALSVLVRYQMGIAVISIYLWMLIIAKIPFKKILYSTLIFALIIIMGSLLDFAFYKEFVIAPINYLNLNLVEGMASYFGTEPWYYYITQFILVVFPLVSIPILLFFIKGLIPLKTHVFTWAILPFILIHFLIAHKEMRFLFPIIYPFLFISFYGFYIYFEKNEVKPYQLILGKIIVGFNVLILLSILIIPSNEMIHNYKYIYSHLDDGNKRVMTLEKDFYYKMAGLKSSFYTPENVISDCVESQEEMESYLEEHQIEKCFFIYKKYEADFSLNAYSVSRVYSVYPDWLTSIDGVDWQSTLQTYSVFIIEKNE